MQLLPTTTALDAIPPVVLYRTHSTLNPWVARAVGLGVLACAVAFLPGGQALWVGAALASAAQLILVLLHVALPAMRFEGRTLHVFRGAWGRTRRLPLDDLVSLEVVRGDLLACVREKTGERLVRVPLVGLEFEQRRWLVDLLADSLPRS